MISLPYLCRVLVLAIAALALAGCGAGHPRVQGEVRYGGEPVDQGGIAFLPEGGEGDAQTRATGVIQEGRYDLAKGPPAGAYRVQIYWHKKTGRQIASPAGKVDERKQAIPPKYNEKTELKIEVKPGRNTLDFDLPEAGGTIAPKSKAPRGDQ